MPHPLDLLIFLAAFCVPFLLAAMAWTIYDRLTPPKKPTGMTIAECIEVIIRGH